MIEKRAGAVGKNRRGVSLGLVFLFADFLRFNDRAFGVVDRFFVEILNIVARVDLGFAAYIRDVNFTGGILVFLGLGQQNSRAEG